ncbi:MAG: hypothetical protein WA058_03900 [Minisyncoccia bacterium]
MNHLNPAKTGLTFGAFIGGWHVVWSLLVGMGWAQPLIDFILWAHMISVPWVVKAFDLSAAVTLVIVTWVVGCVFGYVFARIWNRMHRA